jgi:hypothetical protein
MKSKQATTRLSNTSKKQSKPKVKKESCSFSGRTDSLIKSSTSVSGKQLPTIKIVIEKIQNSIFTLRLVTLKQEYGQRSDIELMKNLAISSIQSFDSLHQLLLKEKGEGYVEYIRQKIVAKKIINQ